jgi:hypothetical protein
MNIDLFIESLPNINLLTSSKLSLTSSKMLEQLDMKEYFKTCEECKNELFFIKLKEKQEKKYKYYCGCNGLFSITTYKMHFNTKRHQKWYALRLIR